MIIEDLAWTLEDYTSNVFAEDIKVDFSSLTTLLEEIVSSSEDNPLRGALLCACQAHLYCQCGSSTSISA